MNLREPLRKFKLVYGLILAVAGIAELYATLPWIINYLSEFKSITQFGHWGPVVIFALLGMLLIFHSQRMIRNLPISIFEFVESLSVLVALIGITFFGKPFD